MKAISRKNLIFFSIFVAMGSLLSFQNCAKPSAGAVVSKDSASGNQSGNCSTNQIEVSGQCLEKSVPCSIVNGQGAQIWDEVDGSYMACEAVSCNATYHLDAGICELDVKACVVAGGSGTQTWDPVAMIYGACVATACTTAGTHLEGGNCLPDTKSCAIANGTGTQSWNPANAMYGECMAATCNPGYTKAGNVCTEGQNIVYRYFKGGSGHYWSISSTDVVSGFNLEGPSFSLYSLAAAGRLPVKKCVLSGSNAAHTTSCPANSPILGYVNSSVVANGAVNPIYYCVSSLTGRPMTTKSSAECGSAGFVILGFGF
jgi:hypothetical protein